MRGYAAGFDGAGCIAILCNDFGVSRLATAGLAWESGRDYRLSLEAVGSTIKLAVDGKVVLEAKDARHAAGMVGCGTDGPARALYGPFEIEEL